MKKLINKLVEMWQYAKTRNSIMSMRIDDLIDMKAKALIVDRFGDIVIHIFETTWRQAREEGDYTMWHTRAESEMKKYMEGVLKKYGVETSKTIIN